MTNPKVGVYDIIVIGAGSGGLNIASFMNRVGFKTLLIDKSDWNIGGDCLNTGCVPSKALIHVARMVHDANNASRFGLTARGKVDMKKVTKYIKNKQEVIRTHENAAYFRKKGMHVALGEAKFAGQDAVCVKGTVYRAKRIVIATGSRPRKLDVPGIENVQYLTNENVFDITRLPRHLLVIGGGPIGIEMAQAFCRLGSKVTVIERGSQFLPKEAPEMAKVVQEQLIKEGVEFLFNWDVVRFPSAKSVVLKSNKTGKSKRVSFDRVLVSIGRELNTDLDLQVAGIEMDGQKIMVDERLRTTNKQVFLCGDIAGSYQFTHAAELHAGVIISNLFSPFKKKVSYDHLPWVTYTSPQIATFGLSEKQLKGRGVGYEKLELGFADDDRAIVEESTYGKLVLFIRKNKIVGGSMVAEHAGELFQEFVLANTAGLDIKAFFNKTYPYPTASRVNKKIITNHFAKKLTPFTKKFLRWLY